MIKSLTGKGDQESRPKWQGFIRSEPNSFWIQYEFSVDVLAEEVGNHLERLNIEEAWVSCTAYVRAVQSNAKRQAVTLMNFTYE